MSKEEWEGSSDDVDVGLETDQSNALTAECLDMLGEDPVFDSFKEGLTALIDKLDEINEPTEAQTTLLEQVNTCLSQLEDLRASKESRSTEECELLYQDYFTSAQFGPLRSAVTLLSTQLRIIKEYDQSHIESVMHDPVVRGFVSDFSAIGLNSKQELKKREMFMESFKDLALRFSGSPKQQEVVAIFDRFHGTFKAKRDSNGPGIGGDPYKFSGDSKDKHQHAQRNNVFYQGHFKLFAVPWVLRLFLATHGYHRCVAEKSSIERGGKGKGKTTLSASITPDETRKTALTLMKLGQPIVVISISYLFNDKHDTIFLLFPSYLCTAQAKPINHKTASTGLKGAREVGSPRRSTHDSVSSTIHFLSSLLQRCCKHGYFFK